MDSKLEVFVLHSNLSLDEIKRRLESTGRYLAYAGVINQWKSDAGRLVETNKNYVICEQGLIDSFQLSYKNQAIKFDWSKFKTPSSEETYNLHINGFPTHWTDESVRKYVNEKLRNLVNTQDYKIYLPIVRETSCIRGFGTIVFEKDVPEDLISMCKIILHNKMLRDVNEDTYLTVSWSKVRKDRQERQERQPKKESNTENVKVVKKKQQEVSV